MMTKVCRVCGRRLPLSELVRDSCATLGVKAICRACYRDERKGYPSYGRLKEYSSPDNQCRHCGTKLEENA